MIMLCKSLFNTSLDQRIIMLFYICIKNGDIINLKIPMSKLIFLRHGQTDSNKGEYYNHFDEPLNETGVLQAKEVVSKLADMNITYIVSSAAPRALQTAQIVSKSIGIPINEVWEDIVEAKLGAYEGKPYWIDEQGNQVNSVHILLQPDAGENVEQFYERASKSIECLQQRQVDGNILVVSHGGMIAGLWAVLSDYEAKDLMYFRDQVWKRLDNAEFRVWE